MSLHRKTSAALAAGLLFAAVTANAATFDVYARENSSSGGAGLDTFTLLAGQAFSVTANPNDLWSAGDPPRWSNANGLTGALFSTGSDDSGTGAGTLIGANFGDYAQGNLTAAYGSLVGQIGGGDYFKIGTLYNGVASSGGSLKLFYWDSNYGDNTQFITATVNVSAVPEPETYALLLAGLGIVGFMAKRRQA